VSVRTKFAMTDARRLTRVAGRLDRVPTLLEDAKAGRVSLGVLAAAARVSTPENEERVADIARDCTPSQAMRVLSRYRDLAPTYPSGNGEADDGTGGEPDGEHSGGGPDDDSGDGPSDGDGGSARPEPVRPEPEPDFWWREWSDDLGRGRIDAALDPVTAALMRQAWKAAGHAGEHDTRTRPSGGTPGAGQGQDGGTPAAGAGAGGGGGEPVSLDERRRRQDPNERARRLATTMLDGAHAEGLCAPSGERFAVQVTVDLATLARALRFDLDTTLPVRLGSECFLADTGRHLDDSELAQILCDANVQLLVHADGVPLWMGNEVRHFTRHQRRAMRHRAGGHGGCEFPGCTQTRFVQAHHVAEHGHDGPTCLANGILLCSWHHRRLHREGWTITTDGDQTFTFWHGTRCLGTTNRADRPGRGRPPDLQRLPGLDQPPELPEGIGPDTPRSATGGERMTHYALDTYLHHLLTA
jgi:hypothetical protein